MLLATNIGIIYCETLEAEIKVVARRFREITYLKSMQWGLHIEPDRLLEEVQKEIIEAQDRVDAIVLGYGRCQALDRLGEDFKVPVLRPEAEDCIGVLLGQENYEEELRQAPGTWFLSPGWTRMGTEFVFRELQINRIAKKNVPPLELARRMLDGFTRALYIDMDLGVDTDELEGKARKIADDLGLCLVRTTGSLNLLEKTVLKALATKLTSNPLEPITARVNGTLVEK